MSHLRNELLHLIETKANLGPETMATMLGVEAEAIEAELKALEDEKVIMGYGALIDWQKIDDERVTALIEVSITPQRGQGFDQIAKRIYSFEQVTSCYLMSGGYDLMVIIEDRSLMAVAKFVAEKIAPLESVLSTRTHFILRKYKMNGHQLMAPSEDKREAVVL